MKRLKNLPAIRVVATLILCVESLFLPASFAADPSVSTVPDTTTTQDLEIEITKKGLGKEVSLRKGVKEWFMLVEVTPENTVVIRQEKENDAYLVDESETHDRPLTASEVDTVIDDFINSVKTQTKLKQK
ncbi:hypothetical protein [Nitrospira sp. Nam74]